MYILDFDIKDAEISKLIVGGNIETNGDNVTSFESVKDTINN